MITPPLNKIYLSKSKISGAGRGIFAQVAIKKGELIETCPVLVFPQKDYLVLKQTEMRNYYFLWGKSTAAVCFGYGSLYNHSYQPNATYKKFITQQIIKFVAIKNINRGEEITVNYNYGQPGNKKRLWIKSIKPES